MDTLRSLQPQPAPQPDPTLEQRLQLLIDAVTDYGIFVLDPEGHIVSWNPGAQRLKGYAREEILGHHFSVFSTLVRTSKTSSIGRRIVIELLIRKVIRTIPCVKTSRPRAGDARVDGGG